MADKTDKTEEKTEIAEAVRLEWWAGPRGGREPRHNRPCHRAANRLTQKRKASECQETRHDSYLSLTRLGTLR